MTQVTRRTALGGAAAAAGAAAVLVPTLVTRPEEVAAAPVVRPDLVAAVRHLLGLEAPAAPAVERAS